MKTTLFKNYPDEIICKDIKETVINGITPTLRETEEGIQISLTAIGEAPAYLYLHWNNPIDASVKVLADAWERAYGYLGWRGLENDRLLPWYFLMAHENGETEGIGVLVRPHAFVSFSVDRSGFTMYCDLRCGTDPVLLNGRTLPIATFIHAKFSECSSFDAADTFCAMLSPNPILPQEPVYGGNNWYYAYGISSKQQIISDAKLQSRLAKGLSNRPFMTIDDGWELNKCCGPWEGNSDYGDMKQLAQAMRDEGTRPGIWIRYLNDTTSFVHEAVMENGKLDPSHPAVLQYITSKTNQMTAGWGYELIKHDYTTNDIFNEWGPKMGRQLSHRPLHFYNQSLTTAEIILQLYQTIFDASNGAYIIGCNCVSHLCAGLVQINRVGDDTSGRDWNTTRRMGINSLVYRHCHNKHFYMADADCIGIIPNCIPWAFNVRWATLLAYSGTPMFLSCAEGTMKANEEARMSELFRIAAGGGAQSFLPIDWMWNNNPEEYLIDGKKHFFDWYHV